MFLLTFTDLSVPLTGLMAAFDDLILGQTQLVLTLSGVILRYSDLVAGFHAPFSHFY
jgi:hypothetical protein